MNKLCRLAFLLLVTFLTFPVQAATNDTSGPDDLYFDNGDFLRGTFESIDPNTGIRWRRSDAPQAFNFGLTNVSRVVFAKNPMRADDNPAFPCRVRLTNQDTIEGDLVSCDGDTLFVNTWYAGKLAVPRKHVESVAMIPARESAVFEGPSGMEGWTSGKISVAVPDSGLWTYRNRAFYASKPASIAREFNLPDIASIQFDLRWQGNIHAAIALYANTLQPVSLLAKDTEPDFGGFYSFQINSAYFDLLSITKKEPTRSLGAVNFPPLMQTNQIHLDFRVDKPRHAVALLINNVLVKEWVDTNGFVGVGDVLRFVHQGSGTVKLSNLRITKWDGVLEQKSTITPHDGQDALRFSNDKQVFGDLQSISNGNVRILASTSLSMPLSRLQQIYLATKSLETPIPATNAVRAFFGQTGQITLQLERWDQQAVTGTHPCLGKIKMNPGAFTSLQFKP